MGQDIDKAFRRVAQAAAATKLPRIAESVSYGTPALKVGGKLLARMLDAETLVLRCPIDEKALLLETASAIYFETDHYKGWPALLVRLAQADDAELRYAIARAWRLQAPPKYRNRMQGGANGGA